MEEHQGFIKKIFRYKKRRCCKKKKYVHLEALSFLQNSAEKRSTTGNFDLDISEEEGHNESDIATTSTLSLSESHSPISSPHPENSSTPKQHSFRKPSRPAKMTPFQESLIKNLSQASSSITQARVDEDADRLYLLSLLPDYKALSPSQKWAFREHVGYFFRQTFVPPTSTPPLSFQNYRTTSTHCPQYSYQEHSSLPFSRNITQLQKPPQPPQTYQTSSCNIAQESTQVTFSPSSSSQSQ
ncbi:unnamed protein product [Acanthoscelides obtectus]|uniref:BESS domain-containing protein n=1 Tax=Acanthoscelides obtectus TaxID=200917 RepID=A0A9P0LH53_ACAOB|nr:unnamed protein product [Acanthoscelides obtectus]CAK1649796.1 hypothetical protein AOBTE_LOCUS16440 [Acanthoscelides obtectus]